MPAWRVRVGSSYEFRCLSEPARPTVFVSGGGSGIGSSIVGHFARQGARVGFIDVDEAASASLSLRSWLPDIRSRCSSRPTCATWRRCRRLLGKSPKGSVPVPSSTTMRARRPPSAGGGDTDSGPDDRRNLRHHYFAIQAVTPGMRRREAVRSSISVRSVTRCSRPTCRSTRRRRRGHRNDAGWRATWARTRSA